MKKHLKYASYILRHKWFVLAECAKRGILWRGLMHDMSKLLPSEWTPYVNNFYGKPDEQAFDFAWLLHQKRNKHHWQWFVLREDSGKTKCFPMPEPYRTEMLCDWIGAGRAITGKVTVKDWYSKNKDKMQLHPHTRWWIENELSELK